MIGVFDSGVGGLVSYKELRRLLPDEDIIYLADKANCPYGTKTKEELLRLVKNDIKRLKELGADDILIACCTASTVHGLLDEEERRSSLPIIAPTAELLQKKAAGSNDFKVTVIATEHTAASHAFKTSLPELNVTELAAQRLVALAEGGNKDGHISRECKAYIDLLTEGIKSTAPSALVLGCTHFSHLLCEFKSRLSGTDVISPAHIGAYAMYKRIIIKEKRSKNSRCLYTE